MSSIETRLHKLEEKAEQVMMLDGWVEIPFYNYFMMGLQCRESRHSALRADAEAWFRQGIEKRWHNHKFLIRQSAFETMPELDKTMPEWGL